MPLRSLCILLIGLAGAPALAQEADVAPDRRPSRMPVWLPRAAFLGTFLQRDVVTPQARLQWQLTLIQERVDAFVAFAEVGGGAAVRRARDVAGSFTMRRMYQLTGLVGLAYRGTRPDGIHVGAHAGVGPLVYGARFEDLPPEQFVAGLLEGRAQLGYEFWKGVSLGVSIGYGSPFGAPYRSLARDYVGGLQLGLFLDWR